MRTTTTEQLHQSAKGIDTLPSAEAARILAAGQQSAAASVTAAIPAITSGAHAMAESLRLDGRLYYIAAGSSGLMAAADAMELGGTFSIPPQQIRILMAGGVPTTAEMPGDTEDGSSSLVQDLAQLDARDTVIAVSASGTTPFTLAAIEIAGQRGATVIGIANNPGSPLLQAADHAILLQTPPEVISGSTRLGAGTAQKIALNMLSTLMAMQLGHIHDGMMVNMYADNIKLRERARAIVATITNCSEAQAAAALDSSGGEVKPAILIAAGAETLSAARGLLEGSKGHLRPALQHLTETTKL